MRIELPMTLPLVAADRPRDLRPLTVAPVKTLASEPMHRYVPFLLASIALTVTLGAWLGMFNLARLTTPWFGSMTPGSVRAHGVAQVFGFVGLFVMGIACHVLPRFTARPLGAPALVRPMLALQAGGVLAIASAFLWRDEPVRWLWLAGSLALVAAGTIFLRIIWRTTGGVRTPERLERWVFAAAAWQAAAAGGSLVAAWQNDANIVQAFWPAALWGFAVSAIFGFGRRILPGHLGWRARSPRAETISLVIHQAGVALMVAAAWPVALAAALPLEVAGAMAILVSVPVYSWCVGARTTLAKPHDAASGYQQYIIVGWMWLFVALAVGPLWTLVCALRGSGVPPLVTDFARHVLAFGFVTQVMMGVASRVLPVFTGNPLWSPRARTAAFYLLNLSVVMRGLEVVVAAGFVPAAWPFIALAGPPAALAVLLFGLNVVGTICHRPANQRRSPVPLKN